MVGGLSHIPPPSAMGDAGKLDALRERGSHDRVPFPPIDSRIGFQRAATPPETAEISRTASATGLNWCINHVCRKALSATS